MRKDISASAEEIVKNAIKVFNNGGIVIFPTDTAFGIGCRIDDEKAVERLFDIRRRPTSKATPVLVSSLDMAKKYWQDTPDVVVEKLIKPYWPGALTIVLQCNTESVSSLVRGNGDTLGIRMPANDVLLGIIKEVGVPIIGSSANFAGNPTPYLFEELDQELVKLVDCVLPGECSLKKASTVIDCSVMPWKTLRKGSIKLEISE